MEGPADLCLPTEGGISDGSPANGGGKRCIFADLRISTGHRRNFGFLAGGEVRAPQKLKGLGGGASSQI